MIVLVVQIGRDIWIILIVRGRVLWIGLGVDGLCRVIFKLLKRVRVIFFLSFGKHPATEPRVNYSFGFQ